MRYCILIRTFIFFLLFYIGIIVSYGQINDSLRSPDIWFSNRFIYLDLGLMQFKETNYLIGVSILRQNELAYYGYSVNYIFNPKLHKGFKAQFDFSLAGASTGISYSSLFRENNTDQRLGLLLGINGMYFRIYYSRNFPIGRSVFEEIRANSITLTLSVPVLERLNINKYKYYRKYRKYVDEKSKYKFSWKH